MREAKTKVSGDRDRDNDTTLMIFGPGEKRLRADKASCYTNMTHGECGTKPSGLQERNRDRSYSSKCNFLRAAGFLQRPWSTNEMTCPSD